MNNTILIPRDLDIPPSLSRSLVYLELMKSSTEKKS